MSINGVGRTAPPLRTQTMPPLSEMNTRPSGRKANDVGWLRLPASVVSEKPLGRTVLGAAGADGADGAALVAGRDAPVPQRQPVPLVLASLSRVASWAASLPVPSAWA